MVSRFVSDTLFTSTFSYPSPLYKNETFNYQKKLINRFNNFYNEAQLEEGDYIKKSKHLYNSFIKDPPINIDNTIPPIEYKNGLIRKIDTQNNMNTITEKLLPVLNQATKISTDGNGDAFASPHIMHMLESINPQKDEFSLVIETNGVLSDENHWKHLSHMYDKYIKVIVTPNSFNRGVYKYLSGGHDNLEVLIHNLHYLKKLRNFKGTKND